MKNIPIILPFLTIGLVFCDCSNDGQDIPIELSKSIISLNNEFKILKVENYKYDTIINTIIFNYENNLVEVSKSYVQTNVTYISSKCNYFLNEVGLADSSIYYEYSSDRPSRTIISKYTYNGKYKIKEDIIVNEYDSTKIVGTSDVNLIYSIKNGNTVSLKINGICSDYFEFNDLENKINIDDFVGDFNGKINRNLIQSSYTDCPGFHGSDQPSSVFEYIIDENGYVLERVEHFYTSSGAETKEVKKITQFEYKFQ